MVSALCLSNLQSHAQNSTKALKIDYQVLMQKEDKAVSAQLYIYSKSAYYTTNYDDSITQALGSSSESILDTSSAMQMRYNRPSDSFYYTAKMKRVHPEGVLIGEKRKTIEWNFIDSTKVIDGHPYSLAEGIFRGRKYLAWYNPEIDANKLGPWKLHGLPGAVIYAYDTTDYISFRALQVKFISEDDDLKALVLPKLTMVSREEHRAYVEEFWKQLENIQAPEGFTYNLKATIDRIEKE